MPRKKSKIRLIITRPYSYIRNEKTVNVGSQVRIIGPKGRYVSFKDHKKKLKNSDKIRLAQFRRNTKIVQYAYENPNTPNIKVSGLIQPTYNGEPVQKVYKGGRTRLIEDLVRRTDKNGDRMFLRSQAEEIVNEEVITTYRIWFSAWVHILDDKGNVVDSSFKHIDSQVLSDTRNQGALQNYWRGSGIIPISKMRKFADSTRAEYRAKLSEWVTKGRLKAKYRGKFDVIIQTNSATYKVISKSYTRATGKDGFLRSIVVEPFLPEYEHSARD